MEQHFQDQIDHILDNFDFDKTHRVMTLLNWAWNGEANPPSTDRLFDAAHTMLYFVAKHEAKTTSVSTGGFEARKTDGYRLGLYFTVEEVDGTDCVGDEGPPVNDELETFVENWPDRMGYPSLFVRKLRDLPLSDEQIAGVLKAIDETCHECWDAEPGCWCGRDE